MSELKFEYMDDFAEAVKNEVSKRLEKEVRVKKIRQNNATVRYGLVIIEKGINLNATIYLDYYYGIYEQVGMEAVIERVISVYEKNKPSESIDLHELLNFEKIRSRLGAKLINYEKNMEYLRNIPHTRFLDLAIVPIIIWKVDDTGRESIVVNNNMKKEWGVSTTEIIDIALENIKEDILQLNILEVVSINKALAVMFSEVTMEPVEEIMRSVIKKIENEIPMYVFTNHLKTQGAIALLQTDKFRELADRLKVDYLYIIPSSIHECIARPCDPGEDNIEDIRKMVIEINQDFVADEEILSDKVYIYSKSENRIAIA